MRKSLRKKLERVRKINKEIMGVYNEFVCTPIDGKIG